jgi:Skp family chaperone for outer membrane proteins
MNMRTLVFVIAAMGAAAYIGRGSAAEVSAANPGIGVVSVERVFEKCRRNIGYRQEISAENERVTAELERLNQDIEAQKNSLVALKTGSADHLARIKEILEKQASLQAQKEFHKQQLEFNNQRWTEQLYQRILAEVERVAGQKALDLVLEVDEVDLPAPNPNELMLAIRTHKVLYSGGCTDITDEIIARLDAEDAG